MKKLITFLGVSPYQNGIYYSDDVKEVELETSFVQASLVKIFGPFDKVVVFVTELARQRNWTSLEQNITDKFPGVVLEDEDIPSGEKPEAIWEIFKKVLEKIDENDTIIFDITHSFRSIPVLALSCVQYLRTLKNIHFEGIYYGAWDAREPFKSKYDEGDPPPRIPIFNLIHFVDLMDWSQSIAEFIKYGETGALKDLVQKDSDRDMNRKLRQNLRTTVNSLLQLQNEIVTCRGRRLYEGQRLAAVESNLKKVKKKPDELPPAFLPLIEKMESKIARLNSWKHVSASEEVKRGFGAVEWCREHNLIQQAYTILQENLIAYFCDMGGLDYRNKEPDRIIAGQSAKTLETPNVDDWHEPSKTHINEARRIHKAVAPGLFKIFESLSGNRNDINHAKINSTKEAGDLDKQIREAFDKIKAHFFVEKEQDD